MKTPPYKENTFKECNDISSWDIEKSRSLVFVCDTVGPTKLRWLLICELQQNWVRGEDKGWR